MHPELRAPVRLEAARGDGGACLGFRGSENRGGCGPRIHWLRPVPLITGARPTAASCFPLNPGLRFPGFRRSLPRIRPTSCASGAQFH